MTLPEPHFIDRDGATIETECIAYMESPVTGIGRTLAPGGYERALVSMVAYRETLLRIAIQEAAKQNLVAYSRYPMIDYLATIAGGGRLAARPASAPIVWTLPAPRPGDEVVPAGTQLRSGDGKVTFATDEDVTILAGQTTSPSVNATCTVAGILGNGYGPGQISQLVAPLAFAVSGANTAQTEGGSASEDTEALRSRIPSIPRGASVAGPSDAYVRLARAAHPDVLAAAAVDQGNGAILVVVLGRNGVTPSAPVLAAVLAACDARTSRPMGDLVSVAAATPVNYTITASLTLRRGVVQAPAMSAAQARAIAFTQERSSGLGRSVDPTAIIGALMASPDMFKVSLSSPASEVVVTSLEWARCTAITLTFAGYASGD